MANYLYNGVLLPDIEAVWTDKETYPYAILSSQYDDAQGYWLLLYQSPSPPPKLTSNDALRGKPWARYELSSDGHSWVYDYGASTVASFYLTNYTFFWTSYDILNTDSSVYLSATDPISLADQTIIEWDGDTTDKASVSDEFGTYYRVADAPSEAQCLGGYLVWDTGLALVTHENKNVPEALWRIVDGGLYLLGGDGQHIAIFTYTTALPPSIHPQSFWNGYLLGQKVRRMLKPRKRTYLYNGTELPSLPVWDRKKYPYALIRLKTDGVTYNFCYSDREIVYGTFGSSTRPHIIVPAGEIGTICISTLTDDVWGEPAVNVFDYTDKTAGGRPGLPGTAVWCNTDIPNLDDGTTYLAASRPVLVP